MTIIQVAILVSIFGLNGKPKVLFFFRGEIYLFSGRKYAYLNAKTREQGS